MKHIPIEFRNYVMRAIVHCQMDARRARHMMMLKWYLWQEGGKENALPGYATCPPDGGKGYPAGWTARNFTTLAKGAAALLEIKHAAKRAPLLCNH